ncbi:MAG TPA: hypothetical protein VKM94_02710 [Blastocatellia bacterium]|nr:hypothetical protein [Blastocatellia bacterium]
MRRIFISITLFVFAVSSFPAQRDAAACFAPVKNSWRGLIPLHSSAADVARVVGVEPDEAGGSTSGPYKVEDGEVTFSFITPSLAKIYHAPVSMVGKVFTIYVKPSHRMSKEEVSLTREFKRCTEEQNRSHYYFVSDSGLAYQFSRQSNTVEMIVYQPSKLESRRLAVNTECIY